MDMYQIKNISAQVKDVSFKERTVEGYFAVFNIEDSDGDIIKPGAFSKTIAENGPEGKNRIMHLWQHNPTQPLAKPSDLMEDEKGLYFKSKISDTSWGTDALKLYKDGVIEEHSIGFNTIKSHWSDEDEANIITEVKLWEGSTVTWGANEFARMTDMKGNKEDIFTYYETICKAYYKGDYTDETFRIIEAQKNHIERQIKDALNTSEPDDSTPTRAAQVESLFTQLNRKHTIRGIINGKRQNQRSGSKGG